MFAKAVIGQGENIVTAVEEVNKARTTSKNACAILGYSPPYPVIEKGEQVKTITLKDRMFTISKAKIVAAAVPIPGGTLFQPENLDQYVLTEIKGTAI